ncbi:MAG: response regulator [Hyphomicrobiales bacterium]|nr:response regulator [Hyphomicrobiales bacterium]
MGSEHSMKMDALVLDDNPEFAEFVRATGEKCGLRASIATDARHFKELLKTARPRVIVLDIEMPEMNGLQLAQWLGACVEDWERPVQLVIVSGKGIETLRLARSVAEISGFQNVKLISKPIEFATLAQIFNSIDLKA